MTREEAHTLLEIMAINITGELISSGHLITEQTKLLAKQLEAIDMAIEALTSQNLTEPNNTCEVDLISRADAIRWVKTECNQYGKPTLDYDSGLKVIEHLKKMPSELPSAESGWIPCSERLPKTGDSVLVTYSDREVGIIWSARPKAWVTYIESNNLIYPVAWMPLPVPYREDGEA